MSRKIAARAHNGKSHSVEVTAAALDAEADLQCMRNSPSLIGRCGEVFHRISSVIAAAVGSPVSFLLAVAVVVIWAVLGPHYHYNDTWQLVINTGTTIVTFLMVFLIQNTQNRDSRAIHLKLDELLRGTQGPRTSLVDLEHATDDELKQLEEDFKRLRKRRAGKENA